MLFSLVLNKNPVLEFHRYSVYQLCKRVKHQVSEQGSESHREESSFYQGAHTMAEERDRSMGEGGTALTQALGETLGVKERSTYDPYLSGVYLEVKINNQDRERSVTSCTIFIGLG